MDLLLLGGIGSLIYWVINRGQRSEEATATSSYSRMASEPHSYTGGAAPMATAEQPGALGSEDLNRGLGHIRQTDPHFDKTAFHEWCSDAFFRIQAAWMHRDLETLRPL